jgi:hypothetical protein
VIKSVIVQIPPYPDKPVPVILAEEAAGVWERGKPVRAVAKDLTRGEKPNSWVVRLDHAGFDSPRATFWYKLPGQTPHSLAVSDAKGGFEFLRPNKDGPCWIIAQVLDAKGRRGGTIFPLP